MPPKANVTNAPARTTLSSEQIFFARVLVILGFYFAKVVNAGQPHMANRAIDAAAASQPVAEVEIVKARSEAG